MENDLFVIIGGFAVTLATLFVVRRTVTFIVLCRKYPLRENRRKELEAYRGTGHHYKITGRSIIRWCCGVPMAHMECYGVGRIRCSDLDRIACVVCSEDQLRYPEEAQESRKGAK